jgi:nucleotide-binding universal stress UspA family protein
MRASRCRCTCIARATSSTGEDFARKSVGAIAVAAKAAGVRYKSVVTKSTIPYKGIINAAKKEGCDAIFIASHGRSGLKRMLLGSVTQEVLAHSEIPVLVFR